MKEMGENGLQRTQASLMENKYVRGLLKTGEFPYLKPLFEAGIHGREDFEQDLNRLLDGIEHEYVGK